MATLISASKAGSLHLGPWGMLPPRCLFLQSKCAFLVKSWSLVPEALSSYLLGLLAMIKCSICSYQCDNWYVSNWRLACHSIFLGEVSSRACSGAFMCCTGMAQSQGQHTLWGNKLYICIYIATASQLDEWCSYVPFCSVLPLCFGLGLTSSLASACFPAASLPLLCFLLQKLFFCTLAPGECFFRVAFFCKASFCFDFLASPKVLHPAVYHSVHFITHQSFAFY